MKGLKPTFISILAIGLLAGSPVGATAQDEAAPPVEFTGRLERVGQIRSGTTEPVGGHLEARGTIHAFEVVDVSDARLAGRMTRSNDGDVYAGPDGPESFELQTQTIRIENDEGAWQGSRHDVYPREFSGGVVVLVGEDAYEGLFAAYDDYGDFQEFRGVIFPAPPPPDPAAP